MAWCHGWWPTRDCWVEKPVMEYFRGQLAYLKATPTAAV